MIKPWAEKLRDWIKIHQYTIQNNDHYNTTAVHLSSHSNSASTTRSQIDLAWFLTVTGEINKGTYLLQTKDPSLFSMVLSSLLVWDGVYHSLSTGSYAFTGTVDQSLGQALLCWVVCIACIYTHIAHYPSIYTGRTFFHLYLVSADSYHVDRTRPHTITHFLRLCTLYSQQ